MFLVGFENRISSTRSSSGNRTGIDVSLHKGTILKGMLPKRKSSKYTLVHRSSLCIFYTPLYVAAFHHKNHHHGDHHEHATQHYVAI